MTSRFRGARLVLARALAWQSKTAVLALAVITPVLAVDALSAGGLLG